MGVAEVRLELAVPADAGEIADLYLASRADALPYLPRRHTHEEVRAWIADTVMRRCRVWVARQGGRGRRSQHGRASRQGPGGGRPCPKDRLRRPLVHETARPYPNSRRVRSLHLRTSSAGQRPREIDPLRQRPRPRYGGGRFAL